LNFPDELAAFRARTVDPGYRALILLGTRQAITAALLIGTLALERVAFLLTKDTQKIPDQVVALLGCSSAEWFCPEGDHSTTLRVYEGVKAIMERWGDLDRRQIVVDVTGGLKPMSVGLEKAAHLLSLATIYIESDYGPLPDSKFGPIAGSQRLIVPPDPYAVFDDLEAAEARRLYAAHDYAGARRIFERLAAHVPRPDDARYQALAHLAAMYAAWDALDFVEACITDLWYARNVLLRYREHCRVLEPPELVTLMRETAASLGQSYGVGVVEVPDTPARQDLDGEVD
jgi:CRISPR-associated protein (TIGR02710 family)